MKTFVVVALVLAGVVSATLAAPVESVESARASVTLQKVDALLGEQAVVQQLQALGVTPDQARARLAHLSEAQVEQLVAQIDLLEAGGTIQGAGGTGPLQCMWHTLCTLGHNLYAILFCWTDLK